MTKMLIKNNYKVAVWNRSEPNLKQVSEAGAQTFTNLEEFINFVRSQNNQNSENIFLMCVSNPEAIKSIYETYKLETLFNQNDHLVDMSTIDVKTVKYQNLKIKNFLEAPVSGSKPQANSGTLVIMTSGCQKTYELCSPLFEILGKKTFYYGEGEKNLGSAAKMKLCVNQLMGNIMTSLSESLKLAGTSISSDTAQQDLIDVLLEGALNCPIVKAKAPNMINGKYDANFPLEHQKKDLRLANELAKENGLDLPVTSKSFDIFDQASKKFSEKDGKVDMCGVYKAYE